MPACTTGAVFTTLVVWCEFFNHNYPEHLMHAELLYTSAPQGLKQGSRGFCTVLSTQGMPANLAQRLEALSMYRHVFSPGDPNAVNNPVCHAHLRFSLAGKQVNLISRIADYGLDYSQRTNKLAHHIVVSHPLPPCGPATLLSQPGVMRQAWDGKCETVPTSPQLPSLTAPTSACQAWAKVTGDAGWGGVVANAWLKPGSKTVWLVFSESQSRSLLEMIGESIALLPSSTRWQATFSTYFTNLPPDVDCKVRCVLAGSEEARLAKARGLVIDLTSNLGQAPDGPEVAAARSGKMIGSDAVSPRPSATVPSLPVSDPSDDLLGEVDQTPAPRSRWSQPVPAASSKASSPPPTPIFGAGPLDFAPSYSEANGNVPSYSEPSVRYRKTSSRRTSVLLMVAAILLIILVPLLGGGIFLLAMNSRSSTAQQADGMPKQENPPSEKGNGEETKNNLPASSIDGEEEAFINPGKEDGNSPSNQRETNQGESPQTESPNDTQPPEPPPITAENFSIKLELKHPILGDLTDKGLLIDGTEIRIDWVPKGKDEDQRKLERAWLEENPPEVTLKLNQEERKLEKDKLKITYDEIKKIVQTSKSLKPSVHIEIIASRDGGSGPPFTREIGIPVIHVKLSEEDLLQILEPKFYDVDEKRKVYRAEGIDTLKGLAEEASSFYAYSDVNKLNDAMYLFGAKDGDTKELERKFTISYETTRDASKSLSFLLEEVKKPLDSYQLFKDMLSTIESTSKANRKVEVLKLVLIMDSLLDLQRQVWNADAKEKAPLLKKAGDKAYDLQGKINPLIAPDVKQWNLQYSEPKKGSDVWLFTDMWTKPQSEVPRKWKSLIERVKRIDEIVSKHVFEIVDLMVQKSKGDFFKVPIILKYQPPASDSPTPNTPPAGGLDNFEDSKGIAESPLEK